MAAAMMSLPKITEMAVVRLLKKIETCKWGQNVGINARNPVHFTEFKYIERFRRYDPNHEIRNSVYIILYIWNIFLGLIDPMLFNFDFLYF